MALRVRSRAPQDENAGMPHLSGKMQMQGSSAMPMMSKSGGLKQQQAGNPERKKLSNITNTLNPTGTTPKPSLKLQDSENSASKSLLNSGASVKRPPAARVPLRNITNENVVLGPSPTNPPTKELKQTKVKPKTGSKIETPKSEEPKPWAKYSAPLADPEMEKLVREWAEEGIEESAGATGDDLEALRRIQQDREIEERVAAVRAYRMPLPSFLYHYDDGVELKEVLEMDPYEKLNPSGPPEMPFPEMDWSKPRVPLEESLVYTCSENDIPSIPEDWHVVKNLPAQKRVPQRPTSRIWL